MHSYTQYHRDGSSSELDILASLVSKSRAFAFLNEFVGLNKIYLKSVVHALYYLKE